MKIIKYKQNKRFTKNHLEQLDVKTNDKVVSLENDTRVPRPEYETRDDMTITNENAFSLYYETIMNSLLQLGKDVVKLNEKVAKTNTKKKKYDPKVPMESNRGNNIDKANDTVVSLENHTRRSDNRAITNDYETRVNSLIESKRRDSGVEMNENVVSLEYDKRKPKPVESRSRDNIVKTIEIAVSSEFNTRSNGLTESSNDIVDTNENRDTKVPKSVKYRRGKIQQNDKSRNIENRKPRKKMIEAAEWVKRRKLFDIVVHIKA